MHNSHWRPPGTSRSPSSWDEDPSSKWRTQSSSCVFTYELIVFVQYLTSVPLKEPESAQDTPRPNSHSAQRRVICPGETKSRE